jgi:NADH-quinone oxidoreductase subunit I
MTDESHNNNPRDDDRDRKGPGGWWRKIYLPAVLRGLVETVKRLLTGGRFTIQYDGTGPRDDPKIWYPRVEGFRGEHYLKRDEQGRVKCVACYMCAAACPAECIHIEAEDAPDDWPDRDKRPKRFEIDLLRCIYCGMCEEACPVDAIALSQTYFKVSETREEKIYDMEKLLALGDEEARGKSIGPVEGNRRGARPTMRGWGEVNRPPADAGTALPSADPGEKGEGADADVRGGDEEDQADGGSADSKDRQD